MTRAERTANSRDRNTRHEISKVVQSERGPAGEESDEMSARDKFRKTKEEFNQFLKDHDLDREEMSEDNLSGDSEEDYRDAVNDMKSKLKYWKKTRELGYEDEDEEFESEEPEPRRRKKSQNKHKKSRSFLEMSDSDFAKM